MDRLRKGMYHLSLVVMADLIVQDTAKFGSYTMIDMHQNKVIELQLVQVSMYVKGMWHPAFITFYLAER